MGVSLVTYHRLWNRDSAKNVWPLEKKFGLEIGHLAALVTEWSEGLPPAGSDGVFTKLTLGGVLVPWLHRSESELLKMHALLN
jgi:hypothetical protein